MCAWCGHLVKCLSFTFKFDWKQPKRNPILYRTRKRKCIENWRECWLATLHWIAIYCIALSMTLMSYKSNQASSTTKPGMEKASNSRKHLLKSEQSRGIQLKFFSIANGKRFRLEFEIPQKWNIFEAFVVFQTIKYNFHQEYFLWNPHCAGAILFSVYSSNSSTYTQ